VRNLFVSLIKAEIIAKSFHILEKPKYHCYDTRKNATCCCWATEIMMTGLNIEGEETKGLRNERKGR
jgi:hypothetical protein